LTASRLSNRVALVTGSSSGIGRAAALLLSSEGAKVAVVDLNEEGGKETVKMISEMGGNSFFIKADVSKDTDAKQMIEKVVEKFGRLDVLINNAGIFLENDTATDLSVESWSKIIDVNLRGVFLGCKYAIPQMMKQNAGSIVNTASVAGFFPARNLSAYSASKAGVIALTKAMAADYGLHNIRVNCVCPGEIVTAMDTVLAERWGARPEYFKFRDDVERNRYPLKRFGKPEDVARAMLFLASDESSWITGAALVVDGGSTSFNNASLLNFSSLT